MDKLHIACRVAYEEKWRGQIENLYRATIVAKEGVRLAGDAPATRSYWEKRLQEDEHELALLQNIEAALFADQSA